MDDYLVTLAAKQTPCFGQEDPSSSVCGGCPIRVPCAKHKNTTMQFNEPLPSDASEVTLPVRGICFVCGLAMPKGSKAVYVVSRGTVHHPCANKAAQPVGLPDPFEDDPIPE